MARSLRRDRARLFGVGAYVPLAAVGARAEHVVAFAPARRAGTVIVAVPRLAARLAAWIAALSQLGEEIWGETSGSRWRSQSFAGA